MQHGGSGGIFELEPYQGVPDRISTTILGFALNSNLGAKARGEILEGYQISSHDHDEFYKK